MQAAQRIFIQNMLSSNNSTYNKVLSGVRECQYLLHNISQAGGADAEGNELLQVSHREGGAGPAAACLQAWC